MTHRHPARSGESGMVTLTALLTMLIVTLIGGALLVSLLGEIQGEFAYHQAVSALSIAEAGVHWAANTLNGPTQITQGYRGEVDGKGNPVDQPVQGAGGQQVGVFDVLVYCADGTFPQLTRPDPNTGCSTNPDQRLINSTGFVPSKTFLQGRRMVNALVTQDVLITNAAVCAYQLVNIHQSVNIIGNVVSLGTATPDITIQPGSFIRPLPSNPEKVPGDAVTASAVKCDTGCNTQVLGKVRAPLAIDCPKQDTVWGSYTCTPGNADFSGGSLTIDSVKSSQYANIDIGSNAALTFVTTGPNDVLHVQIESLTAGPGSKVVVTGGGTVVLNVKRQIVLNSPGGFNVDSLGNLLLPNRMVVRSCNEGIPAPAIELNQSVAASAVFIAPKGTVHMNQSAVTRGAILADTIDIEQDTTFTFDPTLINFALGFNRLVSWQDVPNVP
jgi:hypothetical protein